MFDVSTSTTTVAASDCTMSARETAGRSSMAVDQSRAPGRSATIRDESGENVSWQGQFVDLSAVRPTCHQVSRRRKSQRYRDLPRDQETAHTRP